jgi:DNA-binding beta-propeller fold protein YncE
MIRPERELRVTLHESMISTRTSVLLCLLFSSPFATWSQEASALVRSNDLPPSVPSNTIPATDASLAGGQGSLVLVRTIPMRGVQGSFNHMVVGVKVHRLFATAGTMESVEVLDLDSGLIVRSLEGDKPIATRFSPEFSELYATRRQKVVIYDGDTLDTLATVDLQNGLNELQYDVPAKRLYVGCMNTDKSCIAVIDLLTRKLVGKIPLPGVPMGFAPEKQGNRMFVNLRSLGQVAVIDREKQAVITIWTLTDTSANYPMALDEPDHRLFIGCRKNPQMIVLDTATGKPVARLPIARDADDLFYDAARKQIYVSCGEGFVEVITQQDPDTYRLRQQVASRAGARTSYFSPVLNQLFVAVPERDNPRSEILVYQIHE